MTIGTGDQAPEFDLEEASGKPRLRLQDFRGRRNVRLVFHPFAFTSVCARGGGRSPGEPRAPFDNAETDVIFVSCDASAARQAWKEQLGATYTVRIGLLAARGGGARAYGVFNEETEAPAAARS